MRIEEFDKKADSALKELDDKAKIHLKELFDEAQKQRVNSEKWNKVWRTLDEKNYELACNLLSEMRRDYPDDPAVIKTLAVVFICFGQTKDGEEREKLYQKAEELLLKAEAIKKGYEAYILGGLFALRGNENECRKWLEIGEKAGTLETRKAAMQQDELASVRDKDWFKAIRWKGE